MVRFVRFALMGALVISMASCDKKTDEAGTDAPAGQTATPPAAATGHGPHWDYGAERGPSAWGTLSPDFIACAEGLNQSPIDLTGAAATGLATLTARFQPAALRIIHHEHMSDVVNNGHCIQVNVPGLDTLTVGDESFVLLQYHFHSPSEHTVDGKHFAMEMHLVHQSADQKLAVIGVLVEEGAHNAALEPVWANLPAQKGVENHLEHVTVDVDDLLPAERTTYRYDGSLTTPPCSEGVKWMVLTTPIQASAEQVAAFRAIVNGNNRPTQPRNGRPIATDHVSDMGGSR